MKGKPKRIDEWEADKQSFVSKLSFESGRHWETSITRIHYGAGHGWMTFQCNLAAQTREYRVTGSSEASMRGFSQRLTLANEIVV